MKVEKNLDPTSLVARIIAELQANPEAQQMLLRAMLTNEFLGVPARLDRIEKDVAELKADMAEVKTNVTRLTKDVDFLKGSDLEHRLNRKIRALTSQRLELSGIEAIQTPGQWPNRDFLKAIEEALEDGRITAEQGSRIDATDFILNARRRADRGARVGRHRGVAHCPRQRHQPRPSRGRRAAGGVPHGCRRGRRRLPHQRSQHRAGQGGRSRILGGAAAAARVTRSRARQLPTRGARPAATACRRRAVSAALALPATACASPSIRSTSSAYSASRRR